MLYSSTIKNLSPITMSIKTDIQKLHNRLDTCQRKLDAARSRGDHEMITKFTNEVDDLTKKLNQLKHKQTYELNKERVNCIVRLVRYPR